MSATIQAKTTEIQEQVNDLRQELKDWEKSFAAANQGRKAGRDDIKTHPTIASKYKAYTKLRDVLSGHAPPTSHSSSPHPHPQPQSPHQPSRKRKHCTHPSTDAPHSHQTPRKLPRHSTSTPLKIQHPSQLDPYDSPSSIRKLLLTPRALRTSIGPTPQRDGRVLGLFDAFPDDASPLKLRTTLGSIPGNNAAPNGNLNVDGILTTPSKKRAKFGEDRENGCVATPISGAGRKQSRTPTSAGKRFLLNTYATPTARRTLLHPDAHDANNDRGSATSLHFATPAFLRRDSRRLGHADGDATENGNGEASPGRGFGRGRGVRLPLDLRAPIRGGLSSLLAGLRRMEDERLDGEMDVLRDLEMENENEDVCGEKSRQLGTKDGVLVLDSQAAVGTRTEMPLGVDRGSSDYDSDSRSESNPQSHKPNARNYKKKGQKRTTRRVVMKPQPLRSAGKPLDPSNTTTIITADADGDGTGDGTGTGDGDGDGDGVETTQPGLVPGRDGDAVGGGNAAKKAARKISATAHANYRTLKLRGKGAKSKGKGFGRRFGGRR